MVADMLPRVVPPEARRNPWRRDLPPWIVFHWMRLGLNDLRTQPLASLAYGVAIFIPSILLVLMLVERGYSHFLFPSLSGFMVIAPVLAMGLYDKSRRIGRGEPVSVAAMVFVRPASGYQIIFTGLLLCLLMVTWIRAAVIIYALFFGLRPFPGFDQILTMLLSTPRGWGMLVVGTAVGGLFAAFSYAIGALSLPILLDKKTDALTAMGMSMALVWHNFPVMLAWAALLMLTFLICVITGLVAMIFLFPLIGHASWHCYVALTSGRTEKAGGSIAA